MMTVRERFPQILLILQLPNTAQCCMQPAPLTGAQPEAAVESLWCPIPGVLEFMRSRDDAVPRAQGIAIGGGSITPPRACV